MFHALRAAVIGVPAGLENVVEADKVRLDVHVRVVNGIPDSRLGRQVHHHVKVIFREQPVHQRLVADAALHEHVPHGQKLRVKGKSFYLRKGLHRAILLFRITNRLLDHGKPVFLQLRIIVVIHVVKAHNGAALHLLQEPQHQVRPDKSRASRHKYGLTVKADLCLHRSFILSSLYLLQLQFIFQSHDDPLRAEDFSKMLLLQYRNDVSMKCLLCHLPRYRAVLQQRGDKHICI